MSERPLNVEAWLSSLEEQVADATRRGRALPATLQGFNATTGERLSIPGYADGLPRPVGLGGALGLMDQVQADYLAETSVWRQCDGTDCVTYNSLVVIGPDSWVHAVAFRPISGLGGISDVLRVTPDKTVAQDFVRRATTAQDLPQDLLTETIRLLRGRLVRS